MGTEAKENNETVELDLREMFFLLLSKWFFIFSSSVLAAAVVFAISSFLITPQYTSTASFYIMNRTNDGELTSSDLNVSTTLTSDFEILVTSRAVLERVIEKVGLEGTDTDALSEKISVYNPSGTRILEISVRDANPFLAKEIADAVAVISSEQMVGLMGIEQVNTIDDGNIPSAPSSPNIKKNTLVGGLAGFFISVAIILVSFIFDDTIKNAEDVKRYLDCSVLGVIPLDETQNDISSKKSKRMSKSRSAKLAKENE